MRKKHSRNSTEELAKAKAIFMAQPSKYTRREYATRLGVSTSSIRKWVHELKGTKPLRRDINIDTSFDDIAKELNMPVDEVRKCYGSAMSKIQRLIKSKNDNSLQTMREYLEVCEQSVLDTMF